MKKIKQFSKIIFFDNSFGKSKFAKNLFGPDAGGGLGNFGGTFGNNVDFGSTPANSHDISVSALYFALYNFDLPQVDAEHPAWTYEEKRQEAIRRIETRSADNLKKGYLPELDREGVMTTIWETIETEDSKKMATINGGQYVTREQLWSNFEKYARSKGEWTPQLEAEKETQASMEKTILSGQALGAATWLSHESGKARLLQVWERQVDGSIVTKQYDIGRIVGHDLEQKEAMQVMREVGKLFGDAAPNSEANYPHLMTKQSIHAEDVSTAAQKQFLVSHDRVQVQSVVQRDQKDIFFSVDRQEFDNIPLEQNIKQEPPSLLVYREQTRRERVGHDPKQFLTTNIVNVTTDTIYQAGQSVRKEVFASAAALSVFIKEKKRQRLSTRSSQGIKKESFWRKETNRPFFQQIPSREKKVKEKTRVDGSGFRWETFENTQQKLRKSFKKRFLLFYQAMRFSLVSLVGVESALYAFRYINPDEKLDKKKRKQTERRRKVKEKIKTKPRENQRIPWSLIKEKFTSKRKVKKETQFVRESQTRDTKREKRLWFFLKRMAKRLEKKREKTKSRDLKKVIQESLGKPGNKLAKEKSKHKSQETLKETINNFIFALTLWVLFKFLRKTKREKQILLNEVKSANKKIDISKVDKVKEFNKQDGLFEAEHTPFILLSIIWYLAMVREGAKSQKPNKKFSNKKKTTKLKKIYLRPIPKQAVIFAFNS